MNATFERIRREVNIESELQRQREICGTNKMKTTNILSLKEMLNQHPNAIQNSSESSELLT